MLRQDGVSVFPCVARQPSKKRCPTQSRRTSATVWCTRWWYSQKNVEYCVPDHGMGMRLIAMFFGPHTPEVQTARLMMFSHAFTR